MSPERIPEIAAQVKSLVEAQHRLEQTILREVNDLKSEQIAGLYKAMNGLGESHRADKADIWIAVRAAELAIARFQAGTYVLYLTLVGLGGVIGFLSHLMFK